MVRKQKTKQQLKGLMIKYIVLYCILFVSCITTKQESEIDKTISKNTTKSKENILKTIGFFDYDNTKDTIYYFLDKTKVEPLYRCRISFGNKKVKEFFISTGTGNIQLNNCKKGCIEKSEISTGIYSSEEIEKYIYDEKLNNWFVFETITKQGKEKITNLRNWGVLMIK